jgi:hypothetical protein
MMLICKQHLRSIKLRPSGSAVLVGDVRELPLQLFSEHESGIGREKKEEGSEMT